MKLKENFVLREVADTWVVLPLGEATLDFNGMLSLNESGAMLWRVLEHGGNRQALLDALTAEYDVAQDEAQADVESFLQKLRQAGCLAE
ncbi:MAG: PqqD family protein [Clostridia bacterium]|nr:PqqD family protein [Clostridia bacterium]